MRTGLLAFATTVFLALTPSQAADVDKGCGCPISKPAAKGKVIRSYPICYFADRPQPADLETILKDTTTFVQNYMGSGATVAYTGTKRMLSVWGTEAAHNALRKVWPRVGCIGNYISASQYTDYKRCLVYEEELLSDWKYLLAGELSDGDGTAGQLFCDGF